MNSRHGAGSRIPPEVGHLQCPYRGYDPSEIHRGDALETENLSTSYTAALLTDTVVKQSSVLFIGGGRMRLCRTTWAD